jgi:hypothetical protein
MNTSWTRRATLLAIAVLALAGAAAYASVELARPMPFTSAMLNGQWQCTRTAGIITVCTKKPS